MGGEIFISYRRADRAWAELLHNRLKAEGVEAWYDAHIGAGEDWRVATAMALKASRVFVLLFSENAAQSSDIAKELAAAVFEKKLIIPVRLEDIAPDGAFLYELASRNWVNAYENREAKLAELAKGLAQMVRSGMQDESALPFERSDDRRTRQKRLRGPVLIAAAATLVAAAAALFFLYPKPAPAVAPAQPTAARIAVLPFDTLSDGPQTRHFADALGDEIVTRLSKRIQVVSRDDAATLRGSDRARKIAELGVSLLLDGTVETDGKTVTVRVHLEDPVRHATLWSQSLDGPADKSDQLQASVAKLVVGVLACSNRALAPVHGLTDPDLLSRYIRACDFFVYSGRSGGNPLEMLALLREVAAKAPDFTPVHSELAMWDMFWVPYLPPDQTVPLRQEAQAEAHKALALDPKSPNAYLALAQLRPLTDWAGQEKLLRQGLAGDPDWPFTNGALGLMLASTGRMQEASGYLQKAVAADLQVDWQTNNVHIQCGSGRFEPTTGNLLDAIKRNPGDFESKGRLRMCLKYAQRWADQRAQAKIFSNPKEHTDPRSTLYDVYLVAEESGKPADVTRARNAALAAAGSGNKVALVNAIEALSVLGFTDDAFAAANHFTLNGRLDGAAFLFFTLTANLRKDPRFMQLAARLGMVDYWKSSSHWPDFCAEPGLPYNCQAEANRHMAAK
jgi:TolB-like protein